MAKHYHFIGIGGIGMSGIAQLLLTRGEKVSGSDVKESAMTRSLEEQGAKVFIGHSAANVAGADIVVYSSAIKEDNPEMREAKSRGIRIVKRAQALAGLMHDKKVICVTGSHGKTTTTSLVSHMLLEAGLSPTVAIGGNFKNINSNAAAGEGDYFVAEADESDGSFLYYSPLYSIITNIDREHLDHYKTFDSIIAAYREFMERTDPAGCLFCCGDDENLARLCGNYPGRRVMFGLKEHCDIHSRNIRVDGLSSIFDCVFRNKPAGTFRLSIGGMHNVSNAMAVIALGLELGIDRTVIEKALATYKGAGRRLDIKWQDRDLTVIDDYAHHPTEIKATLSAVRNLPCKRLIAVFQPHRYSRTKLLLDDFAGCFDAADQVILTDIYAASEQPIPGIDAQCVLDAIKKHDPHKEVVAIPRDGLFKYVISRIAPGDIVLMLGAGDITRTSDELASHLSNKIQMR
jgi:UDP-N-acetylmuramate--alanine ligase